MAATTFPTPQDAETAFYQAFESASLEAMMRVWAEDEEVVCIHPGGPRLTGLAAVRESWRRMFSDGPQLRFRVSHQHRLKGPLLAIHAVHENILAAGDREPRALVLATNIYIHTPGGWRMLVHHASPTNAAPQADEAERTPPKVFH